jgi:amidohydrolase
VISGIKTPKDASHITSPLIMSTDWGKVQDLVNSHIDQKSTELLEINQALHNKPELAFEEFHAHDSISDFLEKQGFAVRRKAYGIDTSFEATIGSGGRLVIVCAEYDALPEIGHACGHNLIATSSMAAFLGAAHALKTLGIKGRLRILGTPGEEGHNGKGKLIRAGAFSPPEDVAASVMAHPITRHGIGGVDGLAALDLIASHKFRVEFRGKSAHAAGEPWNGTNALDAAVAAYNNVSMLRQQIRPEERVHGVVEVGGTVPNVIPDYTRMNWYVRAPTTEQGEKLQTRVHACIDAAAAATGCAHNYIV